MRLFFALLALIAFAAPLRAAEATAPPVRVVIIHLPGPAWVTGVSFREQPGIQGHIDHYREALAKGWLSEGGPFLDNAGGMMISVPGASLDDLKSFAAADPAIKSGLLTFQIHPWLVAMNASGN